MDQIRKEKIINIPNVLTLIRIALLPVVAWRFLEGDSAGALTAYLAAMLTDAVDGFIARKFNQITSLGKLLDPLADKLSLVTLVTLFVADGQIPMWVLCIILAKEAAMIIGGAIALKQGIIVYALPIGKITTVAFVLSMVIRFIGMRQVADVLLGISVTLSLIALVWYSIVLMKKLRSHETESKAQ